ncbi:MAG: DUF3857 and transglutaminase domain-containing protein [Marinilabiliales bacterium]
MFVFLLSHAYSQDNIIQIIKKTGNQNDYSSYDFITIFDSTKVDVKESGLSYVNNHILYKVLTSEGAKKLSAPVFDYDPLSAYIEIKNVIIYRKNGDIDTLGSDRIYDYTAPAHMIYWGAKQKMIDVGRLEPGDALEIYTFRKGFTYALLHDDDDDKYIPPMKGHFYDIVSFWSDQPVLLKHYETAIPNEKKVRYYFYNATPDTSITSTNSKTIYSFTLKNFFPIVNEQYMVDISDVGPKLIITTSPDWETKSMWFYGVNEDFGSFETTPEISSKVDEILTGAKDEMDSISRLTHWVADNIRYSGISMGKGEGYTIHKGSMTFTDRCGVCKDKAGMLITMLRAAGFESYAAMTMAGSRIEDIPADQFNHCVTVVKLNNGQYKLLDPTWVPFVRELWSSREQQQNYLMGLPNGADLMETPISDAKNHPLKITGTSVISKNGTLSGTIKISADGQSDAMLRSLFTRNFKSTWKNIIEEEFLSIFPQMQITDISYPDNPYDYSKPLEISIKYNIPDYVIATSDELIFIPVTACNLFKRAQHHLMFDTSIDERKYPFKDYCSRYVEIHEEISLPYNCDTIYLPKEESVKGKSVSFNGNYNFENNLITLDISAEYGKRIYQPDEWQDFKQAVKAQKKFAEEYIILKIKS